MATGSLVLKISADINDFSKQLNRAVRDVNRAADQVANIGKGMSLGITLPVTLAGAALMKMAADNEEAANSLERSFGPAVEGVQQKLDALMKTMPVAGTEIQRMATRINDTAKVMGIAAPAASKLSLSMLQMANDISAWARVRPDEAVTALLSALQGEVGGLKRLGIAFTELEVKNEAFRAGLLKDGQQITALGKGLAAYSLLVQRSGEWSGEAAKRKRELSRSLALAVRDVKEIAERLSMKLIPAFRLVTLTVRTVVSALERVPMQFWVTTAAVAGFAAAIGPAVFVTANLVKAFFTMQAAITLLKGAQGIAGLSKALALFAASPAGAALVAIAAAAGGAYLAYRAFKKELDESQSTVDETADALTGLSDLIAGLGQTGVRAQGPLNDLAQRVGFLTRGIEQMQEVGGSLTVFSSELATISDEVLQLYSAQNGELNEQAVLLGDLYVRLLRINQLREITAEMSTNQYGFAPNPRMAQLAIDRAADSQQVTAPMAVAAQALANEMNLRQREAALQMAQVFDATRVATLQLKERFLQSAQDFATAVETFKQSWQGGNIGSGIISGLQDAAANLIAGFTPAAMASAALGMALRGLQPFLEMLAPPLEMLGKIVGIMLTPILKAIFPVLKLFGAGVALVGEVAARVAAGISTVIGRIFVGVGKALNLLPGSIGNPAIRAGKALLAYAGSQYDAAAELKKARRDIMAMKFGETGDAVDALGDAARSTAEALLNVPAGFRIALAQYQAQIPFLPGPTMTPTPAPLPSNGPGGGGGETVPTGSGDGASAMAGGASVINLVVDGKVLARAFLGPMKSEAQRRFGSSALWAEVQTL